MLNVPSDKHSEIDLRKIRSLARKQPLEELDVSVLAQIARRAGRQAHNKALKQKLPVTVFIDGQLWVIHPNGSRTRFVPADHPPKSNGAGS